MATDDTRAGARHVKRRKGGAPDVTNALTRIRHRRNFCLPVGREVSPLFLFFPNRPPIRPVLSPLPSILLLFLKKKQTKLRAISFVCCFFFSDQEAVKTHDRREPDKNKRETKPGQHQIFPFTVDVVPSLHDRKKSGNHFDSRLPHFVCVCVLKERRQWGRPRQFFLKYTHSVVPSPGPLVVMENWVIATNENRQTVGFPLQPQKRRQACAAENVPLLMLPHFHKKKQHKIFIFE